MKHDRQGRCLLIPPHANQVIATHTDSVDLSRYALPKWIETSEEPLAKVSIHVAGFTGLESRPNSISKIIKDPLIPFGSAIGVLDEDCGGDSKLKKNDLVLLNPLIVEDCLLAELELDFHLTGEMAGEIAPVFKDGIEVGTLGLHGFACENVLHPTRFLHKLPDSLEPSDAILIPPVALLIGSLVEAGFRTRSREGDALLMNGIIGGDSIAKLLAVVLGLGHSSLEPSRILWIDPDQSFNRFLNEIGIKTVGLRLSNDPAEQNEQVKKIRALSGGGLRGLISTIYAEEHKTFLNRLCRPYDSSSRMFAENSDRELKLVCSYQTWGVYSWMQRYQAEAFTSAIDFVQKHKEVLRQLPGEEFDFKTVRLPEITNEETHEDVGFIKIRMR